MIGWVGVWNRDGRPVDRSLLLRWREMLGAKGDTWTQGPFGFVSNGPSRVGNDETALLFDGRLDDAPVPSLPGGSDADPVLTASCRFGDELPTHLNGDFALAVAHPSRQRLLLARDALGVKPLYFAEAGPDLLFSSHITFLLAHPGIVTEPNLDVVSRAVVLGDYSVGPTFYKGIHSLPPGHKLTAESTGWKVSRYWDFDPSKKIRLASFPEYKDAFREVFDRALRRRLRGGKTAVAVSGGVDSSAIFAAVHGRTLSSPGFCLEGPRGTLADESMYVEALERSTGASINRLSYMCDGLAESAPRQVTRGEAPYLDLLGPSMERLLVSAREGGARVLLTGHWGDQAMFPFDYLFDLFSRGHWGTVVRHLRGFGRWNRDVAGGTFVRFFLEGLAVESIPQGLFYFLRRQRRRRRKPWFTRDFRQRAERSAASTPFSMPAGSAHFQSMYQRVRGGYHVFSMEWNQKQAAAQGMEMSYPFLDRDVIAFLMAIPGDVINHRGVPKALLREAIKDLLPSEVLNRRDKGNPASVLMQGMERAWKDLPFCFDRSVGGKYVDAIFSQDHGERLEQRRPIPDSVVGLWDAAELSALVLWMDTLKGEVAA